MDHLTKTKVNFNKLYMHLFDRDANYVVVFSQQHKVFQQQRATLNKNFREFPITAIIDNLKQTEKELSKFKIIGIDYDKIREIFEKIVRIYNELVLKSFAAKSFEQLKHEKIPALSNHARRKASDAVKGKANKLTGIYNSGVSYCKSGVSWLSVGDNKSKKNLLRDCYWTSDMRAVVPELIAYIFAVWTLSNASSYYECEQEKNSSFMKARNVQIIGICCILCLDIEASDSNKTKLVNNLVEVASGEGKSVIMAVTAIVLALLEFDVKCACYSELLSK
eukprot:433380_1